MCGTSSAKPVVRVCVLMCNYENTSGPLTTYNNFDCSPAWRFEPEGGPEREPGAHPLDRVSEGYSFTHVLIEKARAYSRVRSLALSGQFDVFFNLCDGLRNHDHAGVEVAEALESVNAAYTGACSKMCNLSKLDMKTLALAAGLAVPAFFVARKGRLDRLEEQFGDSGLTFPVITKYVDGSDSIGMTKASKCHNFVELRGQLEQMLQENHADVLVEDYIEGTEVTALSFEGTLDPVGQSVSTADVERMREMGLGVKPLPVCTTLAPLEVRFPEGESFKHFDLKYKTFNDMKWEHLEDAEVRERCVAMATRAFQMMMDGSGYGRTDIRVDGEGKCWLLEINAYPSIFYPKGVEGSADIILQQDPRCDGKLFAKLMIQAAFRRQRVRELLTPPYEVVYNAKRGGQFVRATRDIAEGGLVFADEGRPLNIVSRGHVEKFWPAEDTKVLTQYGWPLQQDVIVTWSANWRDWRPINHSCDPNLAFGENHTFNVYARRPIREGEALTLDYATFTHAVYFDPFPCQCGAADCRGMITGLDYRTHAAKYGTQTTSYIYELCKEESNTKKEGDERKSETVTAP